MKNRWQATVVMDLNKKLRKSCMKIFGHTKWAPLLCWYQMVLQINHC